MKPFMKIKKSLIPSFWACSERLIVGCYKMHTFVDAISLSSVIKKGVIMKWPSGRVFHMQMESERFLGTSPPNSNSVCGKQPLSDVTQQQRTKSRFNRDFLDVKSV